MSQRTTACACDQSIERGEVMQDRSGCPCGPACGCYPLCDCPEGCTASEAELFGVAWA